MSKESKGDAPQTWETTREPNLLRNVGSGRYYGRFTFAGKQKWVNLDTNLWTVAKLRIADERGKMERLRQSAVNVSVGGARMGDLIILYKQRIEDRVDIKPKTKRRLREEVETIAKTWSGFEALAPNRITREAVIEWRNRISREGTGFVVPGAKKVSPKINGSSASLINKCIDAIRRMLDIAVERGQLPGNPLYARGLKLKNTPRKPHLPEAAKLAEVFSSIEHGRGRFSRGAADLARFLAYTGCRISEAKGVTWADVDFKRGTLYVHGTKTKASEREVPLIREARSLLERLYADRQMFASHAIDGVAIRLREGEAAVIVGRSGSGKTMFCRSLIGLLPPRVQYSGGRMFWHGTRIDLASPSHAELRGKGMVMLFQNPEKCLNPSFTIGHQLGDLARYSSSLIEES